MIWLSDLLEPCENFQKFFTRPDNKVLDVRNVWLLNYRNMGDSDHHESFALEVLFCFITLFRILIHLTICTTFIVLAPISKFNIYKVSESKQEKQLLTKIIPEPDTPEQTLAPSKELEKNSGIINLLGMTTADEAVRILNPESQHKKNHTTQFTKMI